MANNEISDAMREEIRFFLQANELAGKSLADENMLMQLAMSCAARATEIVFKKLDAMTDEDMRKLINGPN